jgi:hypothetical protein
MLASNKRAILAFVLYAIVQFVTPIALFRGTLLIKDALWLMGTVAPTIAGIVVLVWYVLTRSLHFVTVLAFWLGLACLGLVNLWLIRLIEATC